MPNTMTIHCPGCQTALRVPEGSSGRPARCPNCKARFAIPQPKQMMEETVAAWLVSDFLAKEEQEDRDEDDRLLQELADLHQLPDEEKDRALGLGAGADAGVEPDAFLPPSARRPAVPVPPAAAAATSVSAPTATSPPPTPPAATAAVTGSPAQVSAAVTAPPPPPPPAPGAVEPVPLPSFYSGMPTPAETATPTEPAPPAVEAPAAAPAAAPTVVAAPAASTPPAAPAPAAGAPPGAKPARSTEIASSAFPTELIITGPRPHLAVLEVNQSGVKFAFDSVWLDRLSFRCSMPLRGIFGGSSDREELKARPMVWADRSGAIIRSVAEVEAHYEQPLLSNWTMRDVLNAMGIIESLPRPFCNPMPYFVDKNHQHLSLACSTFKRPDGGITCELTVPSSQLALEWLRNVNGVCGAEYEALERELQVLHSDHWAQLPEQVRQRLSVWCRFQGREKFELYISDAEMSARDAGLAGLVVTDRRLVYHKFHHNGQVDLHSPGALLLKKQDDHLQLYYEGWHMPGHRARLTRIRPEDLEALTAALTPYPQLQIQPPT